MLSKIKILIVEDSIFMQRVLQRIFDPEPDIKVIDIAKNGLDAIEKIKTLSPDCVTMDINMPRMNGLEVLDTFSGKPPCPIIVLSGFRQKDAELSFLALQKGAYDFICKPSGELSLDLSQIKQELLAKVRSTVSSKYSTVQSSLKSTPSTLSSRPSSEKKEEAKKPTAAGVSAVSTTHRLKRLKSGCVVGIAISTGGPNLLTKTIPLFPKDFPAPILIAQHMPPIYTLEFAKRLNSISELTVKEAEHEEHLQNGTVYIAPGGFHMSINRRKQIIIQSNEEVKEVYIPSGNILLSSIALACDSNCIGIILTGLGNDGAQGIRKIRETDGVILVQDEASCIVAGMPNSAKATGYIDKEVTDKTIAESVLRFINKNKFS